MDEVIQIVDDVRLDESSMYGRYVIFHDNSAVLIRSIIDYVPNERDSYHNIRHGDRLTSIAYQFYKNVVLYPQRYWWVIADANPIIKIPMDLSSLVGQEIIIPNIINFKLNNNQA